MKRSVHIALTRIALREFSDSLDARVRNHAAEIVAGARKEDDISWRRLTNWHFYRGVGSPIPERRYGFVHPTSEVVLGKRIGQMQQYGRDDPRHYEQFGRVIHHIQDMSTPSHVLPIYHDNRVNDHFESYMEVHLETLEFDRSQQRTTVEQGEDLREIYQGAAKATLEFLSKTRIEVKLNGEPTSAGLNLFWQNYKESEDSKRVGFGTYGLLHNCFKNEGNGGCRGDVYEIEPETLANLNQRLCSKAIRDTFRALCHR